MLDLRKAAIDIASFESDNFKSIVVNDVGGRAFLGVNEHFHPDVAKEMENIIAGRQFIDLSPSDRDELFSKIQVSILEPLYIDYNLASLPSHIAFFILDTLFHSGAKDENFEVIQTHLKSNYDPQIVVDALIGRNTINALSSEDIDFLPIYRNILENKSDHLKFGAGFDKRFAWRTTQSMTRMT